MTEGNCYSGHSMHCIGVGGLGYREEHMKDANPFSVRNDKVFTMTPCTWISVPLSPSVVQATKGPQYPSSSFFGSPPCLLFMQSFLHLVNFKFLPTCQLFSNPLCFDFGEEESKPLFCLHIFLWLAVFLVLLYFVSQGFDCVYCSEMTPGRTQ